MANMNAVKSTDGDNGFLARLKRIDRLKNLQKMQVKDATNLEYPFDILSFDALVLVLK